MTNEPTSQDIQNLRNKFIQKVQEEKKEFHPKDITKVNADDCWLRRFLIHHDLDVDDALSMLLDTCEWRKSNKVNELNENVVNKDILEEGSLFVHNKDKDGKPLFIFKCAKHYKGQKDFEELKKCVIYWFERVEKQDSDQITIFFDMTDSGLGNLDMEYTKYLINLCKLYYPNFLNYILIFEMPWVLNAAFKIIKTWLPTKAVQKIKFVTKATLKEFVDKSQALKLWGGQDPYVFSFVPLSPDQVKSEENKKKVHFADGSPLVEAHPGGFGDVKQEDTLHTARVKISPQDAITFSLEWKELTGTINVTNISDSPITYKVKTTSPEKFKVRPSIGMLSVGAEVQITVVLLAGYTPTNIVRDKFLIMNLPLTSTEAANNIFNDSWKKFESKKLEEHLLRCKVNPISQAHNGTPGSNLSSDLIPLSTNDLEQKMSQLLISMNHVTECCCQLKFDMRTLQRLSVLLACITICFGVAIIYLIRQHGEDQSGSTSHCMIEQKPISEN